VCAHIHIYKIIHVVVIFQPLTWRWRVSLNEQVIHECGTISVGFWQSQSESSTALQSKLQNENSPQSSLWSRDHSFLSFLSRAKSSCPTVMPNKHRHYLSKHLHHGNRLATLNDNTQTDYHALALGDSSANKCATQSPGDYNGRTILSCNHAPHDYISITGAALLAMGCHL